MKRRHPDLAVWFTFIGLSVALVACSELSVAPRSQSAGLIPHFYISADSNPAECAAWQCRSLTQEEINDLNAEFDLMLFTYAATNNWGCFNLVVSSRGILTMGNMYRGTVSRHVSGYVLTGSTAYGPTSIYLAPESDFASPNERNRTLIHEGYHVSYPNDDIEANAFASENSCF